jgi:hypothetical protein
MPVLIFALILILIVGLVIYLVDMLPMDGRLALAAKAIVLLLAQAEVTELFNGPPRLVVDNG